MHYTNINKKQKHEGTCHFACKKISPLSEVLIVSERNEDTCRGRSPENMWYRDKCAVYTNPAQLALLECP
jgi:hypothetical protein